MNTQHKAIFSFTTPLKLAAILFFCTLPAWAGNNITRVSVDAKGGQANGRSSHPFLSANSRYVIFRSDATNLVPGKGDGYFIKDLATQKIDKIGIDLMRLVIASHDARYLLIRRSTESKTKYSLYDRITNKYEDIPIDGVFISFIRPAKNIVISQDGRYIAFESKEPLIPNLAAYPQGYVYDRKTKEFSLFSKSSTGLAMIDDINGISVSGDGRYVVFDAQASNLVKGCNKNYQIYLHDRTKGETTCLSVDRQGKGGFGVKAKISADGHYVVFSTTGGLEGVKNYGNLYLYDIKRHTTTGIFTENSIKKIFGQSASEVFMTVEDFDFSANGRYIIAKLESLFLNNIWKYDIVTKAWSQINIGFNGGSVKDTGDPTKYFINLQISADGRYVSFESKSSEYVEKDNNEVNDIFIHDGFLSTNQKADLTLLATKKPVNLKTNTNGGYTFSITNNGPSPVARVNFIYGVNGGSIVSIKPSRGTCSTTQVQATCDLVALKKGQSLTLKVVAKAENHPFSHDLTVHGSQVELIPTNNYLTFNTPVVK
jgi:Tol biopolymer transport system component